MEAKWEAKEDDGYICVIGALGWDGNRQEGDVIEKKRKDGDMYQYRRRALALPSRCMYVFI